MSTDYKAYIYGTIATVFISLLSVCGAALIPCLEKKAFAKVKVFLIALSIGTLLSDAILHLIPQAIGLHGEHGLHNKVLLDELHNDTVPFGPDVTSLPFVPDHGHAHDVEETRRASETRKKRKASGEHEDSHEGSHEEEHDGHAHEERMQPHLKKLLVVVSAIYGLWLMESMHRLLSGHSHVKISPSESSVHVGGSTQFPQVEVRQNKQLCGLKPAAFSILFGDSLHNLCDGFAIGAAFALKPTLGVTTSIAVASHELPHELGDFVVLLSSGLSFKWALILNLLSALFAVIGVFPGIALTNAFDDSKGYIFAAVSGIFIYIALVDMAQELLCLPDGGTISGTILHNAGVIVGIVLMALLAIYEDDIYSAL